MGYITIDVGTTNTRIRYIENGKLISKYSSQIGVKDTAIRGTLQHLKDSIKDGIDHCLRETNEEITSVEAVIATGMITSNLGLLEIPHLEAPVSIENISQNIKSKLFDDIAMKPIYFIPGVKNRVENLTLDNFKSIDMMRGEEVEAIGAALMHKSFKKILYISPGSHTKFVLINKDKEIEECSTTLTGEILWALSKETILANSIDNSLVTEIDKEYLFRGIESVRDNGFTKTCFYVRLMNVFLDTTPNQRANFLFGALIYEDIKSIKYLLQKEELEILIGGKKILRELYYLVLNEMKDNINKVKTLNDQQVELLSSIGAIEIYKRGCVGEGGETNEKD